MADKQTVLGVTHGGREFLAESIHNRSLFKIKLAGGGRIPDELDTAYGDLASAKNAVDRYIEKIKPQPKSKKRS